MGKRGHTMLGHASVEHGLQVRAVLHHLQHEQQQMCMKRLDEKSGRKSTPISAESEEEQTSA